MLCQHAMCCTSGGKGLDSMCIIAATIIFLHVTLLYYSYCRLCVCSLTELLAQSSWYVTLLNCLSVVFVYVTLLNCSYCRLRVCHLTEVLFSHLCVCHPTELLVSHLYMSSCSTIRVIMSAVCVAFLSLHALSSLRV